MSRNATASVAAPPAPLLTRPRPLESHVITGALVDRVLFEGTRATAVRYRANGAVHEIRARAEIIVSGGTLQSPAILMRSGIGPGATAIPGH